MAYNSPNSIGYGPRSRIYFDGNAESFQVWETRFTNYLYTIDRGLYEAIIGDDEEGEHFAENNRRVYAELVQVIDKRSLHLIMHDTANDGRAAFRILKEHYASTEKPRVLSLYEELTTLKMASEEDTTDYLIRAERAATGLRLAGETITDNLIIAMILKGLPEFFKPFIVIHTQLDKYKTLSEFKAALNTYANTEAVRSSEQSTVMISKSQKSRRGGPHYQKVGAIQCLSCGKSGHKSRDCRSKSKLQCHFCEKPGHVESVCFKRKQSPASTSTAVTADFSFLTCADTTTSYSDKLLVDCGATCHIINDKNYFICYDEEFDPDKHFIELADGRRSNTLATARGTAKFTVLDSNGISRNVTLKNALLAPTFPTSLFSVRAATDCGAEVIFKKGTGKLVSGGTHFNFERQGQLYFLRSENAVAATTKTLQEWHTILGHMNYEDILKLQSITQGMSITQTSKKEPCLTCQRNKMSKLPKSNDEKPIHATHPLERIHSDICGPISPKSREGYNYIINFVDEYSSMVFVYFLRTKDEASTALKSLIADVAPIGKISEIHSDNGAEYMSKSFQKILIDNGIKQTSTAPYSPYQNGKSERNWRSLMEMARCLRSDANIARIFWPFAVRYAQYLRNRSYQRRTKSTAYELFTGHKPDMKHLHPFGTSCIFYKEGAKGKLDARGEDGTFLGINPINEGYYVLNPTNNSITTSRNVRFQQLEVEDTHYPYKPPERVHENLENQQINDIASPIDGEHHQSREYTDEEPMLKNKERPQREVRVPTDFKDYYMTASANVDYAYSVIPEIPQSYEEAMSSPDSTKWKAAMDHEIHTLTENQTWNLTVLPKSRQETKGRWVYTIKQSSKPGEVQYKARYVARGFTQIQGIDYEETYSPTARFTSIRTLLQKAANDNHLIHQMDVKGAYLNAPIDKEIYIQQPPEYEERNESGIPLTCHLLKSLYGLKQSGRNWHTTLTSFLKSQGFTSSIIDPCIYKSTTKGEQVFILFWVDDILICSSELELIREVKDLLSNKFRMDDRGELKWFLGIDFQRLPGRKVEMSQQRYIESILERFKMSDCKVISTPGEKQLILKPRNENEHSPNFPYRQAIGSLLYLATATRPDISWIVSKLSQYLEKPSEEHIKAVKRVFRYLKGTKAVKLTFSPTNGQLIGYTDSDWASDPNDRRSTSGYIITLGSAPISWRSRKQSTVSLSSCEAEFIALAEAAKEMIYLRTLCSLLSLPQLSSSIMYCDNQGALSLTSEGTRQHQRTKHIDVRYYFIKEQKDIIFKYVPTDENLADILTKPLCKTNHKNIINGLKIEGAY